DAVRIIRSIYPPVDLFEDIADPADWPFLISAEQKTNPRVMENLGNLELVPPHRRIGGQGASYLMAPFTHVSPDRPTRFSAGNFGVLYCARRFETALLETRYHHARFLARTDEAAGWVSQFREVVLKVGARLSDLRAVSTWASAELAPDSYEASRRLGASLKERGSDGIVYPSIRDADGECVALFFPDCASNATQGRHLDYHWNGQSIDFYRDASGGQVFQIVE
ncbi:MAG TPA: RES family NAD+ phosphorylase, partial [Sphingomicrobium sp.]|nr:RES family NAD+ phosphorylase [Sphingomicrobium sp.]